MPKANIQTAQGPTPYPPGMVQSGAGEPAHTAPKGTLYMRTDGSSSSTRAYINTNGSTSWTNVTTAG
jgi:hypothetical protein